MNVEAIFSWIARAVKAERRANARLTCWTCWHLRRLAIWAHGRTKLAIEACNERIPGTYELERARAEIQRNIRRHGSALYKAPIIHLRAWTATSERN